jgi:hypothetical protein
MSFSFNCRTGRPKVQTERAVQDAQDAMAQTRPKTSHGVIRQPARVTTWIAPYLDDICHLICDKKISAADGLEMKVMASSNTRRRRPREGGFDAETENTPELQRTGWQAILDNFGRHVEAKG